MISNDRELAASLEKLARLHSARIGLDATEPNLALRRSCAVSLSRLINQISEEISRYRAGTSREVVPERMPTSGQEVQGTRRKLQEVESLLRERAAGGNAGTANASSLTALRRTRNELTEELLRFEVRNHEDVRA